MSPSYEQFLTSEDFSGYEDPAKYAQVYVPQLEKYRASLEATILPQYRAEIPKSVFEDPHFNALKYVYDNKLLTAEELAITDSDSASLLAKIAAKELSSVQVFKAFAKRATIAHQLTNCALELFTDEGLQRAEFLDDFLAKNGKTIGPLHGLPISLKEQMNYKGKITHGGYVGMIDHIPAEHGTSIELLERLGAVYYVRTNQPQTLMHLDSNNNFIGCSRNPHNRLLSPGGSSSGEGALVGFGGSAIGVGSDIGGSIRAPAAYSGCVGLRPTTLRCSINGGVSSGAGQESVLAVQGPMARTIEDLDLYMDAYINVGKPWDTDATILPLPWRKVAEPEPKALTIAIVYDDGLVKPSPPIQRGLKHTADKLAAAGVKVVEWKPLKTDVAYDVVHQMYTCDGNNLQRELLAKSGEPLTKLTKWNLNYGHGAKELSISENRKLNVTRNALRQEYSEFLIKNNIDFIISPAYNNVAPRCEEVYNWSYTSLFNILDLPTLTFQTGLKQNPEVDTWDLTNYKFRSALEELELKNYLSSDFKNAPIGLQLSGRRYFDEEVVAAGKLVHRLLEVDLLRPDAFK